jgi:hypothetical protein
VHILHARFVRANAGRIAAVSKRQRRVEKEAANVAPAPLAGRRAGPPVYTVFHTATHALLGPTGPSLGCPQLAAAPIAIVIQKSPAVSSLSPYFSYHL